MNILSYHESTVVNFFSKDNNFYIELESVSTDCSSSEVKIIIEDLSDIIVDSNFRTETLDMPCSDGEVLTLNIDREKVFILIEWNDFMLNNSFTNSYEIYGRKIQTAIVPPISG